MQAKEKKKGGEQANTKQDKREARPYRTGKGRTGNELSDQERFSHSVLS